MSVESRARTSAVVTLLGLPTDVNSSFMRGAAKAPPAIRAALASDAGNSFTESGLDLRSALDDAGDLAMTETDADLAAIEARVGALLDAGTRVLSLGGDHSITYPVVRAFAARWPRLSIVHIDAHPDLYESFGGNRFSHACPFARILEATSVRDLVQIGIRTMSDGQRPVAQQFGVRMFGPDDLRAALDALPSGPIYLSIDLDGLDPAFAPGVSHREPGGLSVREAIGVVRSITGRVVGADVVELNPDRDADDVTALVAAKLVKEVADRLHRDSGVS